MAEKLGISSQVSELKIGTSFIKNRIAGFHSMRYDFKPASVDSSQVAKVDIGENNDVKVNVPHIEGSVTNETVYRGSKKPYQKECVLIIDHVTGEITLEKLTYNIQLKKTRSEGGNRKYAQGSASMMLESVGHKSSSSVPMKNSPSYRQVPSPDNVSSSPIRTMSPAVKSPNLPSPIGSSQCSPSMPTLVSSSSVSVSTNAQTSSSTSYRQRKPKSPPPSLPPPPPSSSSTKSSMPTFSQLVNDPTPQGANEDVGILSDSSSSSYYDGSSSESECEVKSEMLASNNEIGVDTNYKSSPSNGKHNATNSPMGNMPQLSQLSEDLQLSESESDSD